MATRARQRVSVVQVLGEILLTAGVLAGLFVVWQVWINNEVSATSQAAASDALSRGWATGPITEPVTDDPTSPVVTAQPAHDETFANLIVPRFGDDYRRPIGEGVGFDVLNDLSQGIGHYERSQLPGEIGNFALASHRSAYGGGFHTITELELGDSIYVETEDGWYRYVYRNSEYVTPDGVGVVAAIPQVDGVDPTQRYITLTTCNPLYSTAERIAAYGVFDQWYPRAGGAPEEIADLLEEDD